MPEVAWSPVARLGLGSALRRLAEAGERCVLHLADGRLLEATSAGWARTSSRRRIGEDGRTVLVPFAALGRGAEPLMDCR